MIILGIDPGSRVTGYGVIACDRGSEHLIEFGVIRLRGEAHHHLRLKQIYDELLEVIERHNPDECAVEMPVYGSNAQSMLKLGRAQAAAMLAALNRQIPVAQYTPKEVKKSVTGNGNASKQQVWFMVRSILQVESADEEMLHDASDALAVGLCHAHRDGPEGQRTYADWSAFLRDNPGRVA